MTDTERTITVTADAAEFSCYHELAAVLFKAAEWAAAGRWSVIDTWEALTDEQRVTGRSVMAVSLKPVETLLVCGQTLVTSVVKKIKDNFPN